MSLIDEGYVNNYKVNGKPLIDIFEDSDGKQSISPTTLFRQRDNFIKFAKYVPEYHPFNVDMKMENYYIGQDMKDSSGRMIMNFKGCIPKGFAPGASPDIETPWDTYISNESPRNPKVYYVYYKGRTGDPVDSGTVKVYSGPYITNHGISAIVDTADIPVNKTLIRYGTKEIGSTFILTLQGAGGGGAGGYERNSSGTSYGGGCGPLAIFNVLMPYSLTQDYVPVLKIVAGRGGLGGAVHSSGSNGGETYLFFNTNLKTDYDYTSNPNWEKVITLSGGRGGRIVASSISALGDENLPIATTGTVYVANNLIRTGKFRANDLCGNIAYNNAMLNYTFRNINYRCIPGTYLSPDTRYVANELQMRRPSVTPYFSSGDTQFHSTLGIGNGSLPYSGGNSPLTKSNVDSGLWWRGDHRWYGGISSFMWEGGSILDVKTYDSTDLNTLKGHWGSGGGAGYPDHTAGWVGDVAQGSPGGDGGDGMFYICG